jgi:hypothetical protein
LLLAAFVLASCGCTGVFRADCRWPEPEPAAPKPEETKEDKNGKPPKTMLEWVAGGKKEEEKGKKNGEGKEDKKNGEKKDAENGRPDQANGGGNGNGQENGQAGGEEEEEKRVEPDRPHLAEASTTVGKGRVVLEAGYTYNEGGPNLQLHTYPEALLRVGMFADWFEARIGQNFATQRSRTTSGPSGVVVGPTGTGTGQTLVGGVEAGPVRTESGALDMYLGVKLGLTEQKKYLPESCVVLQTTVPTGSGDLSAGEMLPGVNYDFSWEIIKHRFAIEGVISANRSRDDVGHFYVTIAEGLTPTLDVTRNLQLFLDMYGLFPAGAIGPNTGPQYYAIAGVLYYLSNDFAIDFRAGPGLTEHSADYLIGSGLVARF